MKKNNERPNVAQQWTIIAIALLLSNAVQAQQATTLLLSGAIDTGISQYQSIKAKQNYVQASSALVQDVKNQYLPNVIASVQNDFGTVNGQFGPLLGFQGLGVASAGPTTASQRWDAGFGALYLINTNWEVFTFGRLQSRIKLANSVVKKDSADLQQEVFIQSVKISAAYLNVLAAQRIIQSADANLQRALAVRTAVLAKTKSGLVAGVDSSIANAEVSRSRLVLIDAKNNEQQAASQLRQLINSTAVDFVLDSAYIKTLPASFSSTITPGQNPQVKYFQSRIDESIAISSYLKKSILPGVNLFGIFQTRGSGFGADYTAATNYKYSGSYFDGLKPTRSNYIFGVAMAWNIMSPLKIRQQVKAQQFITSAYKNEEDLLASQLNSQLILADQRIDNTRAVTTEVPVQYKAAADAFLQKSVLYKNGLTDIIDLQQALFAVNRAETDLSVANINVWQALLLKAAASGDFDLFRKQVQ
ncbi:MAG: TolC family protein [Bacteroidetes bacterium]|nr:TolC family protein [Bacteroidota bacterium]